MRWVGNVVHMGRQEGVGRADGRRPFGRPSPRMDDNIKIDLQDIG